MKSKKYLERKRANKIRQHQYGLSLLGLDSGPIYFCKSEIKDLLNEIEIEKGNKIGNTINDSLAGENHG